MTKQPQDPSGPAATDPSAEQSGRKIKVTDRRFWASDRPKGTDKKQAGATQPSYVRELEAKLQLREKQIAQYLAALKKVETEKEAFKARLEREKLREVMQARGKLAVPLFELLDNFERALDSGGAGGNLEALRQGSQLIYNQFVGLLGQFGVEQINPKGEPFDPLFHEAVMTGPAATPKQIGSVLEVLQRGYRIGEQVLRPGMVKVAR